MPHPESYTPPRGEERRLHPRVTTDLPITIALTDGSYEARLRDISRAGVCFFLDRRVPEMSVLKMRLDLTSADGNTFGTIHGGGVVVRCQPVSQHLDHYEVAVFLNDLTDSNRELLDDFLAERAG